MGTHARIHIIHTRDRNQVIDGHKGPALLLVKLSPQGSTVNEHYIGALSEHGMYTLTLVQEAAWDNFVSVVERDPNP